MIRVGLTGGIGSGKSSVARRLAGLGAVVIDADAISRELVRAGEPALAEITAEFGSDLLTGEGQLDRAALAAIVFNDAARLRALNEILHPKVAARTRTLLAQAPADAVVVYDVPLLVENGLQGHWDHVVVVMADQDRRRERLVRDRGMEPDEADRRMAAQATDEQRRSAADFVIDNNGSPDELDRQVAEVWQGVCSG